LYAGGEGEENGENEVDKVAGTDGEDVGAILGLSNKANNHSKLLVVNL
jgi:hypothetical protein